MNHKKSETRQAQNAFGHLKECWDVDLAQFADILVQEQIWLLQQTSYFADGQAEIGEVNLPKLGSLLALEAQREQEGLNVPSLGHQTIWV